VPERKIGIIIADRSDGIIESAKEEVFTCFRFTSLELEPGGARTNGEEAGVVMSGTSN